ncbi:hypothetical protein [Sphingomonas sp. IC4-52]|uniref:hypothetical protein n=1 Tax=Sphingomonas sp. IC4-52 TaxID=2887202 RepID=UPI001D125DE9|nr:hypothetical protein [Sphingomonas sp. IC4-52]MCC2981377.1 hypothetical protein [Sphingomonas sp. IC4-52]
MLSFSRHHFLAGTACLLLAGCGADDVASPGAGNIDVIVTPAPTPTPPTTGTPTPSPITAAQFAVATTQSGVTITADEQFALVNAGTNNNVNGAAGLNGIYPVNNTPLTTPSNPTTLGNFFVPASFVGAVSGPDDTSFQGWTCNSSSANFGGTTTACTAVPNIGTLAAGAACPTGTTDDGLVAGFRACRLPEKITSSLTLPKIAGVFYRFRGQTEVGVDVGSQGADSGVTLTIAPGVVLAADSSEASNDLILVNRGSRINAVGTAAAPIIFTSQQNLTANGVSDSTQGQWGGLILLGRAPTAVCAAGTGGNNQGGTTGNDAGGTSTTCQAPIEGVPGRFYGGTNQADNSGTLQYVQIRYTGIAISEGNELQGLTLGGTGSGTTIDHVQSHNSADDGIEIFGGTTNLKYFVVTGADDDGFDVDNGWRGFMQFIIAAQKAGGATADSFATEIDSNGAEDLLPRTFGRYANFTFIQTAPSAPAAIRLRGGADFAFVNGVVKTGSGQGCINLVAGAGSGDTRTTIRPADAALQDVGPPTFNSVYFQCQGR